MINWEKYRELFPVVAKQTYFMTAGGGATPKPVLKAIQERYQLVAENGGRGFGDNIKMMEACREKIAKLINADKEHIAFIPNVSFGMNALAHSLPREGSILLAKNDFASSILPWKNAGHAITWASSSASLVDKLSLSQHTDDGVSSIVASYIHYANGYKLDLEKIKELKQGANFIVNGTQGIGAFPIDVKKQGIDALVCSCYKWMCCGEGIAFIYIHPDLFAKLTPALVGWRSVESAMNFDNECQLYKSARIFELGWDNMTIFSGCDAALDLIEEVGIANIAQRIYSLTDYLIAGLQELNIPILSDTEAEHRSGIVLLGPFPQLDNVVKMLESQNIWVTQRDGGIRIALHFYNNEMDIDNLLNALKTIA
ncbi:aminotransferase class V-fold PLP-dependent enzyme [Legionella lansingensis]|uniref:aminotransferase class V-fold PLP-dependent enzyme n=1 Tax=Legionella lansingensis TaxID=45067 RepID=UPI00104158CD|nr:aminotransferase class V-fold PLP-dependent enzyme [Legionella lansingensis]